MNPKIGRVVNQIPYSIPSENLRWNPILQSLRLRSDAAPFAKAARARLPSLPQLPTFGLISQSGGKEKERGEKGRKNEVQRENKNLAVALDWIGWGARFV